MASNPYKNKVIYDGQTLIDLTGDSVSSSRMLANTTAHDASGAPISGNIATKTSSDLTVSGATVTVPSGYYATQVSKSVASGTAGTPTATKGTVSNHSISVTPSVTNTTGYITGSTKTGTAVTVSASELVSGTKSITENGTGIDVTNYASVDVNVTPKHTATITQGVSRRTKIIYNGITYRATDATFNFSAGDTCQLYAYGEMGGGTIYEDGTQIGTSDVNAPYTYTLPDCDVEFALQTGTGSGRIDITKVGGSITVNPLSVTTNGTYTAPTGTAYSPVTVNVPSGSPNLQAKTNIAPTTSSQTITADAGYDGLSSVQINAMPSGTAGTPTATKGTVSNHSVTVTPSVTNTTGYINGGTKTGTGVTVTASELVSGSQPITQNGTVDVTNLAEVVVNVSGGGSSKAVQIAAGGNRVSTTSYTAVSGQSITVLKTGTYDVYWAGFRSSTGGTSGSCLYVGNSAHSSGNQTTFSNHVQAIHLSNVSLTADQTITVRARARGTNYYMYVANLTIVEA